MTTSDASVLLFFIDGLGIGTRGPFNPLDNLPEAAPLAVFQNETAEPPFDGIVVPTDPRLGVEGRPQSASGQTTILTGINAPAQLGYHKQGFPNKPLLEIIGAHSIFKQLRDAGVGPVTFANAYTDGFFTERPRWISATTAAVEAAGMAFRNIADLKNDAAVFMDFTNRLLIERGVDVAERTEDEAADVLARIASENRFTLYEYFITDKVGHEQDMTKAREILTSLARFIRELLARLDLKRTTVILTSDHGNIEDLSSRNHTLHMVPTIIWGAERERSAATITTLADITPAIVSILCSHKKAQKTRNVFS
ncbi:MAG TPA: alkaline phosphatase family protein [Pyrinomonadaceae bacterium]|nr:alkaline phosphatase family protein [Pyrinomonadaceae bacterium]